VDFAEGDGMKIGDKVVLALCLGAFVFWMFFGVVIP
jgi:hypothetical protein